MQTLSLPAPYREMRPAAGRSAIAAGRAAAACGIEEGALFWGERARRLECALVLRPDRPQCGTLPVIYLGALAVADALGAFAPPITPIAFSWPCGIVIDGALAGRVSLDCAPADPDAVPRWAVLGAALVLAAAEADEPGRTPFVTSTAAEGFGEFSAAGQIEGFARHFLRWLGRWEADGLAPVAAEWWRRAYGLQAPPVPLPEGGRGVPLGLDDNGNLRVSCDGRECVLGLAAALAGGGDG